MSTSNVSRDPQVVVTDAFLRSLTGCLLGQVRGRGSKARRNQIAAEISRLLSSAQLGLEAQAAVAQVVIDELNADGRAATDERARHGFAFDPDTGRVCWSTTEASTALGVKRSLLVRWRSLGTGPRWIKLGDGQTSSVVYPIQDALEWLAERERATRSAAA